MEDKRTSLLTQLGSVATIVDNEHGTRGSVTTEGTFASFENFF
jgi:hypothetical protein